MNKKRTQGSSKPQNRGYSESGASVTRRALKGFTPNSSSPNEDINYNNRTLRQRSRMLYMSSPVATSAINTNRTKVVGVGLSLKASIDRETLGLSPDEARDWQKKTELEFRLWAARKQNCDALGLNNFYGLQQLAMKSWLMNGDAFALLKRAAPTASNPYSLRIHLIEADRVCTPDMYNRGMVSLGLTNGVVPEGKPGAGNRIYDGVEVDRDGRVTAYHVCSVYPDEITADKKEWIRVTAYGAETGMPNILHIMDSERAEQYRGVPYLAQVIEPMLQMRRYTESELMAAIIQSFFTAWIETNTDSGEIPFNEVGGGDINGIPSQNPEENNRSYSDSEYEMGPGTVLHLGEGETVKFGSPNIPTAGFDAFMKTICRMIGAALEIPSEVLLKEFNSNYSASRAAILEAWEAFRMRRTWFVDDFCQPVYELWLSEAIARGRLKAPGFFENPLLREAWSGARWIGPVQGSLDPQKEANASILLISHGLKTHEQVAREIGGGDWTENAEQLARENEMLKAAEATPVTVIREEKEEDEKDEE